MALAVTEHDLIFKLLNRNRIARYIIFPFESFNFFFDFLIFEKYEWKMSELIYILCLCSC